MSTTLKQYAVLNEQAVDFDAVELMDKRECILSDALPLFYFLQ